MNFQFTSDLRAKLLLCLMLIVFVATAVTSYLGEHNEQARYEERLEAQFQDQSHLFAAQQEARRSAILEKCRAISHSVRLRAALEEEDVEDLYRNAFTELQGIYHSQSGLDDKSDPQVPAAAFFRFLDARGRVLSPGSASAGYTDLYSLGEALAPMGRALGTIKEQTVGYVALNRHSDLSALYEVVVTKIPGWNDRNLGALVLGFPVRAVVAPASAADPSIGHGIWLGQSLYTTTRLSAADRNNISKLMLEASVKGAGNFPIILDGAPYLLFYKALDRGTQLQPAYEVSFYQLATSLRQQQMLRWKIIGLGLLVLVVGFAISLILARNLAKPVDKLVAGSMENYKRRQRAERDLVKINHQLEQALTELKATQQQVIQQERLRALGEMASGVAHDFNNTLTPILGFTDLLLERQSLLDDKVQTARFLKLLHTSALDAANVVRRLREFYRPLEKDEELRAVDLSELVTQVVSLTEPRWRRQAQASGSTIRIEKELKGVRPVAANESSVREALTNLVFNAVDAMPGGGVITLETREERDHAVLRVSDTGAGMTEEVRRRCLEPFFSTKGEKGTGLGLAMVYGIIKRHRGELEIESTPGEGTTFIIRLPFAEPVPQPAAAADVIENAKPTLNVLVVDDEMGSREVLSAFLRSDGHAVTTANNGREGLEQFHDRPFDIVVTDRAMPEMNGEQMAGLMKKAKPEVPVVLVTGFGNLMQDSGTHPPWVDAVLCKPVTLKGLLNAVDNLRHAA